MVILKTGRYSKWKIHRLREFGWTFVEGRKRMQNATKREFSFQPVGNSDRFKLKAAEAFREKFEKSEKIHIFTRKNTCHDQIRGNKK